MSTFVVNLLSLLCLAAWIVFLLAIAATGIAFAAGIGQMLIQALKETRMFRAWNARLSRRKSDARFFRDAGIKH